MCWRWKWTAFSAMIREGFQDCADILMQEAMVGSVDVPEECGLGGLVSGMMGSAGECWGVLGSAGGEADGACQ
jgi:hypothetical protein